MFLISCFALFLLLFLLKFFTDINQNVIISIALVMVFLIIFTYVLRTEGKTALNVSVIIFSFIFLPLFILWYSGFLNCFSLVGGILMAVAVMILGILSIVAIVRLNYVELVFKS